jgi:protein O-mannosyl-transferase
MSPGRLKALAPVLLLAGVTVAAHANGLGNGFVWDDRSIVVESPDTRDFSRLAKVLLSPDEVRPYYRPLCRASYLVDYQLFGMDPRGFHAVNLALHLASVLAFHALGLRLFQRRAPALLAAMLLAVHPIHVEAVAFVSARNGLLALLFCLLATLWFMMAVERRSIGAASASGVAFFLGLASKEQAAMTLPFLGAWLLVWPAARLARWRGFPLLIPHLAGLAAYLVARSVALGGPAATEPILPGLAERLLRNAYVIPSYLGLMAFPDRLSNFHEVPADYLHLWWLPLAWLLLGGLVVLLVRRPSPAGTVGLLWFALNLVPVLGVIPIPSPAHTVMAERFIHASALGIWLVVADLLSRAASRVPARVAGTVAVALVVALGARTWARTQDWKDDLTLFQSAARAEPRSLLAHFNLGVEFKDRGDLEAARQAWEAALRIAPGDPGTHTQLGTLAAIQGRYGEAEAHFRTALAGEPGLAEASLNLGKICERTGRPGEAVGHYTSVTGNPSAPQGISEQAQDALRRMAGRR